MDVWLSVMLEYFFILIPFVVLIFWNVFSFIFCFPLNVSFWNVFKMLLYAFIILFNFSIFLNVYVVFIEF